MHVNFCALRILCQLYFHSYWWAFLAGFDCLIDPVCKLWNSRVDAGFHGVGTSQTPRRDSLQDVPVLCVTNQRTPAVTLREKKPHKYYLTNTLENMMSLFVLKVTGQEKVLRAEQKIFYGIKPFIWSIVSFPLFLFFI